MFLLLRFIVEICTPFVIAILLIMLGAILIFFKRNRFALLLNVTGLSILVIFGYGLFVGSYFQKTENLYAPIMISEGLTEKFEIIKYIVEGKRLATLLPHTKVVICGGVGYDPIPNAHVVSEVAKIIGISERRIIMEDRPRDTEQEALYLSPLLGEEPFILITSASHMNRA